MRGFWAVFFLSLTFRLIDLGGPTFWLDEGYSLAMARLPLAEMWQNTLTSDLRFPLFYAFLHGWIEWFPVTEFWLRLPQVLLGSAAVALAYGYAAAGGRRAGLFVAAVLGTSHYLCLFEQECRPYSWVFLAQAGYLLGLDQLARGQRRFLVLICLSAWLGCYSDYRFGVFAAISGGLALGMAPAGHRRWVFAGLAVAALGCLPLVPWFKTQSLMTRANLHLTHPPLTLGLIMSQIPSLLGAWYLRLTLPWATLVSVCTVWGLALSWRRLTRQEWLPAFSFLVIWVFLIAYSSGVHPIYSLHSALIVAYPFLIWLALSMAACPPRLGQALLLGWTAFNLAMTWQSHANLNWHKQNWRELAKLLKPAIPPQELVVVVPAYQYNGLSFYWEPPNCLRMNPRDFTNPELTGIIDRHPSCWFIMANDQQVDRAQFVRTWMDRNLQIDQAFQIENAPYYEINGDSIQIYHARPRATSPVRKT